MTFLTFCITTVGLVCATLLLLYAKFGKSLGMRLMTMIAVSTAAVAMSSFYIGLNGADLVSCVISSALVTPVVVGVFLVGYRNVVGQFNKLSTELVNNTSQLASTARATASAAANQAAAITQVSATVTELTETSRAATRSARQVAEHGEEASRQGSDGARAINQAREVMGLIARVSEIVELVSGLADQSNFLAVNAGIEAAKAGEHGRGFSVVAGEVRSLAEQSKQATRQIRNALMTAEGGRQALDSVQTVVSQLARLLEESVERARHIAAATNQQAAGITQISSAMLDLSDSSNNLAHAAEQLSFAVVALEDVAHETRHYVTGRK